MPQTRDRSNSDSSVSLADIADTGDKLRVGDDTSWEALRLALRGLQGGLDVFPPLKIAVGGLLECVMHVQASDQFAVEGRVCAERTGVDGRAEPPRLPRARLKAHASCGPSPNALAPVQANADAVFD